MPLEEWIYYGSDRCVCNQMGTTRPTVVDLFSGAGGFSLGFHRAGFSIDVAVDNYDEAVEVYNQNFSSAKAQKLDLSEADAKDIFEVVDIDSEDVDIVIGGPPCQGFSVMGKRDPDDERNDLLLRFADIIRDISPSYFVMENVKGLVTGDAEEYLDLFLDLLDEGGFKVVEPIQVLNAANYGVPQNRERVFVLGYKEGMSPPQYPKTRDKSPSVKDAIGDLPSDLAKTELSDGKYMGELGQPSDYVKELNSREPINQWDSDGLSGFDPVNHTEKVRERFSDVEPGENDDVSGYHRLNPDEPANTLRAGSDSERGTHTPARPIHPTNPRVVTVRESARLQSFPDWFEFHETKYHSLRQIGNSVPPILAEKIGLHICRLFNDRCE